MTIKEFFGKLTSKIIWVNLLAMFLIIVAIAVGIWIGLERYTMHGVEITVPNVKGMRVYDARQTLERQGLVAVVTDSGYNKTLPSGTVLEQTPANNSQVKPGREIHQHDTYSHPPDAGHRRQQLPARGGSAVDGHGIQTQPV